MMPDAKYGQTNNVFCWTLIPAVRSKEPLNSCFSRNGLMNYPLISVSGLARRTSTQSLVLAAFVE